MRAYSKHFFILNTHAMKLRNYLGRIQNIDRLIRQRSTGPPSKLADQVGLSESMLYHYINFMKSAGAPIQYSKRNRTYYYRYQVEFRYGFDEKNGSKEAAGLMAY